MTAAPAPRVEAPYAILRQLYPGLPSHQTGIRALGPHPGGVRRFLALPGLDDTRMYLPGHSSLASGALRRARRAVDLKSRATTWVVANAIRLRLDAPVRSHLSTPVTEDCVETQLSDLLHEELRVAIFLGPPRANRKPVLQALGMDGSLLAVAKVGINPLTSRLAAREAAALRSVAQRSFQTVVPPVLLGEHTRDGHTMVVQSPLEVPKGESTPAAGALHACFREIARSWGVASAPLGGSRYLEQLRGRLEQLPADETRALSEAVLSDLAANAGSVEFGAWHGDLSPWNMAADGRRVLVWDWERFSDGVPVGYDALHYTFLPRLKDPRAPHEQAGVELIDRAVDLLAPVGVGAAAAPAVAMLYLLEIAGRFMTDGQASTGILGGDVERWMVPALRHHQASERR